MKQNIYLKDETLFANEFVRVIHGNRGDYVEFKKDQIIPDLISKFNNNITNNSNNFYYYWLYPVNNPEIKVYFQQRIVKYADYKIGMYYVSPDLFLDFKDPEKLF